MGVGEPRDERREHTLSTKRRREEVPCLPPFDSPILMLRDFSEVAPRVLVLYQDEDDWESVLDSLPERSRIEGALMLKGVGRVAQTIAESLRSPVDTEAGEDEPPHTHTNCGLQRKLFTQLARGKEFSEVVRAGLGVMASCSSMERVTTR
jgi:hypothetical protein